MSAGIIEMRTGLRVRVKANNPAEICRIPSAKLLAILADHNRLKDFPNE
jgi:hypothetical protein